MIMAHLLGGGVFNSHFKFNSVCINPYFSTGCLKNCIYIKIFKLKRFIGQGDYCLCKYIIGGFSRDVYILLWFKKIKRKRTNNIQTRNSNRGIDNYEILTAYTNTGF